LKVTLQKQLYFQFSPEKDHFHPKIGYENKFAKIFLRFTLFYGCDEKKNSRG